jgi:regulator of nucleoside diphosphate kinase
MSSIVVTQFDFDRLEKLVVRLRTRDQQPRLADALEEEIENAEIVDPRQMPADVVTMNTETLVRDLATDAVETVRLVFPGAASPNKGAISVLAPLGLALLGTRSGDEVSWDVPGGHRRLRVEKVTYQPEASGRFDL